MSVKWSQREGTVAAAEARLSSGYCVEAQQRDCAGMSVRSEGAESSDRWNEMTFLMLLMLFFFVFFSTSEMPVLSFRITYIVFVSSETDVGVTELSEFL